MKKYQLWLERKSYSQHLINLIKIKSSVQTPEKCEHRHRKTMTSNNLKYQSQEDSHMDKTRTAQKLGDISYPILNRQLNNKKYRLLRSFQVFTENYNMARRMREVKSVVSLHSPKQETSTSFNKRKLNEKKYEQSNDELRESKFRKFLKWRNNVSSNLHRYYLSIQITNISKFLRIKNDFAGLWCELETQKGAVKSEMNKLQDLANYKYRFAFENGLGDNFCFRLFACRGIASEMVGQFILQKPQAGENSPRWIKSTNGRMQIQIKMKYSKISKSKAHIAFK